MMCTTAVNKLVTFFISIYLKILKINYLKINNVLLVRPLWLSALHISRAMYWSHQWAFESRSPWPIGWSYVCVFGCATLVMWSGVCSVPHAVAHVAIGHAPAPTLNLHRIFQSQSVASFFLPRIIWINQQLTVSLRRTG